MTEFVGISTSNGAKQEPERTYSQVCERNELWEIWLSEMSEMSEMCSTPVLDESSGI